MEAKLVDEIKIKSSVSKGDEIESSGKYEQPKDPGNDKAYTKKTSFVS